jgi:hypothetical protein
MTKQETSYIAALPMYDWPEVRAEVDAEWTRLRDALRARGIDAPEGLTRENMASGGFDLAALWRHPQLLFAQTCWGPMEAGLSAHVQVVGQPDYSAFEGGEGRLYSSAIVMRQEDIRGELCSTAPPSVLPGISPSRGEISLSPPPSSISRAAGEATMPKLPISPSEGEMAGRPEGGVQALPDDKPLISLDLLRGKRLAYNSRDSMSGFIALGRDLETLGETLAIFSHKIETGGHRASIFAVVEGRADVAAIDCRSWAMAQRFEPAAKALAVVGWTARRKGLPYITARAMPEAVVKALREALSEVGMTVRPA